MQGRRNNSSKCLVHDCPKICRTRGLCYSHYNGLRKRIHSGDITWEEAEAQGLLLPAIPKRRYWEGFVMG